MENDSGELQMAQIVVSLTKNKVENCSNWFQTENDSGGLNRCGVL